MSEWKPIETAPKDGTRIIVFWKRLGHCEDATLHMNVDGILYHVLFDGESLNDMPSHWMPLPAIPGDKKGG